MGSANFKKGGSVWELKKRDIQGQQPLNSLFLTMMGHCWVPTKSIRWGGNAIPTLARPLGRKSCVHFFFAPRTSLRIRSLHTDSPMYHYIYIYIYILPPLTIQHHSPSFSLSLSSLWLPVTVSSSEELKELNSKMGMVVVISLPLILFSVALGFGCYFLGRARGRRDIRTNPQVYGVPTPPPSHVAATSKSSCSHPPHTKSPPFTDPFPVWARFGSYGIIIHHDNRWMKQGRGRNFGLRLRISPDESVKWIIGNNWLFHTVCRPWMFCFLIVNNSFC